MGKSHFGTQIYNFVIANPRAFLIAYNSNMDFMAKEDGCINPETFVTILAEHRNIESEKLFNQASMDEAVQLLHQTTELEDRMFSETQNAGRNSGAGIGHVTIEHTKKGIKVQQVVTVLVALVGLALAILGNPTQSNTGVIICVVSVVWLLAAIPLQKWWHHG
ncbi:hypothetical protein [Thioflavicoccus mobilis]|nr:hypothetical protein [Thioflavicoccus mobilis]